MTTFRFFYSITLIKHSQLLFYQIHLSLLNLESELLQIQPIVSDLGVLTDFALLAGIGQRVTLRNLEIRERSKDGIVMTAHLRLPKNVIRVLLMAMLDMTTSSYSYENNDEEKIVPLKKGRE